MKTKVLMVCLGNICRSPLAEGILKSIVNPEDVFVDSAGTGGYHIGHSPDPRSIDVAKSNGIDISNQICRKFNTRDFDRFDVIYAMDKENYNSIINLGSNLTQRNKVRLLVSGTDGNENEVPDPYYGGKDGFEKVFQIIEEACKHIAKLL
ncbi:MAG: protein-tyrosine phosphatase [Maribacter sp.]|jgi:protein-tyrosine phosphatase